MSAIGMKLTAIGKDNFFDSEAVIKRLSAADRKVMSKYGAYVRTDSRQSIKKAVVKNKKEIRAAKKAGLEAPKPEYVSSKPGETPRSRRPNNPIKRILFGVETPQEAGNLFSGNVVIGFGLQGGNASDVPGRLEKGGTFRTKRGKVVQVAARPTMVPAQKRVNTRMPAMFADSL
jgi:hypothetical protein